LTALINVSSGATVGTRVVVASSSTSRTPNFRNGSNVIQIQ
jgi:hypothetical protein